MSTYKYAKESVSYGSNQSIPDKLRGENMIDDDLMRSVGLYSKQEIEEAKFTKFSRFGRILDPYGRVNPGREYLFFVKPDLHICAPDGSTSSDLYEMSGVSGESSFKANGLTMNPQLNGNSYFRMLIDTHPEVVKQLQYSVSSSDMNPFCYLLSSSVNSYLGLDSSSAKTMDTPATIFGTTYNYLQDSEASDEAFSFSLEFVDDKYLNTYHFFKAYNEYHIARKSGLVTPPSLNYYRYKRLHNTMGIYKFIVAEDMETILYWAYLWGVIPTSCPREAFQDPSFSDGLTFSVNFESAFVEDMNPLILNQFNSLMLDVIEKNGCKVDEYLPIEKTVNNVGPSTIAGMHYTLNKGSMIDGTLPVAAFVDAKTVNNEAKPTYRLRWYAP